MQNNSLTPKFFFVSLGALVALITTVSSFLVLLFETLNNRFPDALNGVYEYGYNTYNFETIRGAIATLIIVFPVFLVLSYFWRKLSNGTLSHVDAVIRRWMIYLVLFLAGIVVIVDLVTLVRYFVSGEITIRFIWKVVGALFVAGLVGCHYYFELKSDAFAKGWRKNTAFVHAAISLAAIIGIVIWSFSVIGSPKEQRAWRFDQRRVNDLQTIQYQIINYWQQKEKLPESFADLTTPISSFSIPVEPEKDKGNTYEYKKTGAFSFELCATFSSPMPQGWNEYSGSGVFPMPARDIAVSSYPGYGGGTSESWDHESGRTCFARTIDKDLYPPYPKPGKN